MSLFLQFHIIHILFIHTNSLILNFLIIILMFILILNPIFHFLYLNINYLYFLLNLDPLMTLIKDFKMIYLNHFLLNIIELI